jgi:hypothetical protein
MDQGAPAVRSGLCSSLALPKEALTEVIEACPVRDYDGSFVSRVRFQDELYTIEYDGRSQTQFGF